MSGNVSQMVSLLEMCLTSMLEDIQPRAVLHSTINAVNAVHKVYMGMQVSICIVFTCKQPLLVVLANDSNQTNFSLQTGSLLHSGILCTLVIAYLWCGKRIGHKLSQNYAHMLCLCLCLRKTLLSCTLIECFVMCQSVSVVRISSTSSSPSCSRKLWIFSFPRMKEFWIWSTRWPASLSPAIPGKTYKLPWRYWRMDSGSDHSR